MSTNENPFNLPANYVQARRGGTLVGIGDSITARNSAIGNGGISNGDSWLTHLALQSGGALLLKSNAGVGGNTTTQMVARFATDVAAYAPNVVGISAGTNDNLDGSNLPNPTAANIKSMVASARAIGATPFLCTIPPAGVAALATPAAPTVVAAITGGTLAAGTYSYRIVAVNTAGVTLASAATTGTVASGTAGSCVITAPYVEGASAYQFYGRIAGSELLIGTNNTGGQQDVPYRNFTDTGAVTPSGALPGANTSSIASALTAAVRLKITTINAWIRRYAAINAIPLVDMYALLVDPTTGLYKTGWSQDGTHPTSTTSRRMGALAWSTLQPLFAPLPSPTVRENADPTNLWANGCNVNGTANLPTSWNSYGGSGGNFTDTNGTVAGFAGNGFTVALTAPDVRFHDGPAVGGTPWSAGDRILIAARVQTSGCEAGGLIADLKFWDYNINGIISELYLSGADTSGVWSGEFTAPAYSNVGFRLFLSGGAGQITIGEVTLINLTKGQLVTP